MIKATAMLDHDRRLYLFGLSAKNLQLLQCGQPIAIELEALGGAGKVVIFFGETETDMARDLADMIGPNTTVHGLKENSQ